MAQGDLVFIHGPGEGYSDVTGYVDNPDLAKITKRVDLGFVPSELTLLFPVGISLTNGMAISQIAWPELGSQMVIWGNGTVEEMTSAMYFSAAYTSGYVVNLGSWNALDAGVATENGGAGFWFHATGHTAGLESPRMFFIAKR